MISSRNVNELKKHLDSDKLSEADCVTVAVWHKTSLKIRDEVAQWQHRAQAMLVMTQSRVRDWEDAEADDKAFKQLQNPNDEELLQQHDGESKLRELKSLRTLVKQGASQLEQLRNDVHYHTEF